jgi:hypothetical protein
MGTLVVLLLVAALVGGVAWNHRNKAAALEGVEFHLPDPPHAVTAAITALYCQGARAAVKNAFSRISVTSVGAGGFNFDTKKGDRGQIEVHPHGAGSIVRARASSLYLGGTRDPASASGMMALSVAIVHMACVLLRVSPYAANMKRFQRGLEHRITKQAGRQIGT